MAYRPPLPPRWRGRDSLELVHKLNERSLTLLSEAVTRNTGSWPRTAEQRALWSGLGGDTIQRAARFPFVILDARFTDGAWWRTISQAPKQPLEDGPAASPWPAVTLAELLSELLVFAWHTVKCDPRVARLSLGMQPSVARTIAALTPQQLAIISARQAGALHLRWQDDPEFWTRLLLVARDGTEDALSDIHLHAKLLLSGALIACSEPSETGTREP